MTTMEHTLSRTETVQKEKSEFWGLVRFMALLLGVFLIIRFGFSFAIVSGHSMNPTFEDGSFIVASQVFYEPELNDIVLFTDHYGLQVVKRVIGVPGDTVEIVDNVVYVNGAALKEDYTTGVSWDMPKVTVPKDSYFVLGDNRTPGESLDSRSEELGFVNKEQIHGERLF